MGFIQKIFGKDQPEAVIRSFDLLTAPVAPGAIATTCTKLPWKNPRFKSIVIAEAVAHSFERVDDLRLQKATKGEPALLIMSFENTSRHPARLAAVVVVETDELEPQEANDFESGWPTLIEEP